jgi:nitrogen-specific signal transduction histidine kinase
MDSESASRALAAVNDLNELLRLSQGAAERLEHEVHGPSYEMTDVIARELHRLRRLSERLRADTERLVSEQSAQNTSRRHPLRRASDRGRARPN